MKLKQILAALLVIFSTCIYAQLPEPAYVGSAKFSAKGSGAAGIPTINFTIPNGVTNKNRVMVITMTGERYNAIGNNFFVNSESTDVSNAVALWDTFVNGNQSVEVNGYQSNTSMGIPTILQNWKAVAYYYNLPDNMMGTVPITFARLALPQTANDEISFIVSVYENVKSFNYIMPPFSIGSSISRTALAAPVGRTAAEIMYMVNGGITQETDLSLSAGWTVDQANRVNNITTSAPSVAANEHDGIAHIVGHRNAIAGDPTVTVSRTGTGSTYSNTVAFHALLPFASPSIAGNVYRDTTGASTIEGSGANAGGTYVNVIDNDNRLVYSATVGGAGAFTVPQRYVLENNTYRLELSKNTGTIGFAAPVKELPIGWGTVGESTFASPYPNDGSNDGTINLTAGTTNITGLRFGINTCAAGTVSPTVQNINNVCPDITANLNSAHSGTVPASSSLIWFTNNTHTGTALSGTQITQAGAGTYYAFYYDSLQNCYSPASNAVVVNIITRIDSDGDGLPNECDLDDDNDGILDDDECGSVERITNGNFPTSGGNTNTLAGWTIGGTYAASGTWMSPTGRVHLNTNGLEFRRDINTISTLSQNITGVMPGSVLSLNELYWFRTAGIETNNNFTLTISYAGTVYATIASAGVPAPIVNASNGATVNMISLPVVAAQVNRSAEANLMITLPHGIGTIPASGELLFTFTAGSAATQVRDLGMQSVSLLSCKDTDGDSIPDYLDLDSDGDGCSDALEGGAAFTTSNLVNSSMPGGNSGVGYTGTSSSSVIQNLGNSVGNTATTIGVPTIATTGQTIGDSQNGAISSQCDPCIISATNPDSDGDGVSNFCDLDDDNDGILDTNEGKCNRTAVYRLDQNATIAGATINPNGVSFNLIFTLESGGTPVPSIGNQFTIPFSYSGMSDSSDLWEGINSLGAQALAIRPNTTSLYTGLPANNSTSEITSEIYSDPIFNELINNNSINQLGTYSVTFGSPPAPISTDLATLSHDEFTLHSAWNLAGSGSTFNSGYYSKLAIQNQLVDYGDFAETEYLTVKYGSTYTYLYTAFTDTPGLGATNEGNRGFIQMRDVIVEYCLDEDTDGDGIPNYLDLDSDNDGCLDAIEGGAAITNSQLVNSGGTVTVGIGSSANNQNLCAGSTCVDANGVPTIAGAGQTVGDSQNAAVNSQCSTACYKPGIMDASNTYPTKHGITALQRAGSDSDNWPMIRESAWTVLESKEKGFVVNRVATTAGLASITNPVEGMMVYDQEADCLKIFTLKSGDTVMAWHCIVTPACPD